MIRCPMCQTGEPPKVRFDDGRYWVECGNADCCAVSPSFSTRHNAIDRWGRLCRIVEQADRADKARPGTREQIEAEIESHLEAVRRLTSSLTKQNTSRSPHDP